MATKFKRIRCAKPQVVSSTNQIMVVLADGKSAALTTVQVSPLNTEAKMSAELQKTLGSIPDLFVHLNRNGRYCIATGEKPLVWPEDEKETAKA